MKNEDWVHVCRTEEITTVLNVNTWRNGDILITQEGIGDFKVFWAPGEERQYHGQERRFNDAVKLARKVIKMKADLIKRRKK